jgi:hypothetical protein
MRSPTELQRLLAGSNISTVLTDIANAAIGQPDAKVAVEAYALAEKLREGIVGVSFALAVGTSPAGSAVVTGTITTALGAWMGQAALRHVRVTDSAAWGAADAALSAASEAVASSLRALPPTEQASCDAAVAGALPQSLDPELRAALRRAVSLAVLRAGAVHAGRSVPEHARVLLFGSPHSPPAAHPLPRPVFSVVSGAVDGPSWFPYRGVLLAPDGASSSSSSSSYVATLASSHKAASALRAKLTGAETTHDGAVLPTANPPANRWATLDDVLKVAGEAAGAASLSLVLDVGAPALYLSPEKLRAEAEAAAAAEAAALAAAGGKKPAAKPAAKPGKAPPAPTDPKVLWAFDPALLPLPNGGPAEDDPATGKYVLAKPAPEVLAADPAARVVVSAPRYAAVLGDALAAHVRVGALVDATDPHDAHTRDALAARVAALPATHERHAGAVRSYTRVPAGAFHRAVLAQEAKGVVGAAAAEAGEKAAVDAAHGGSEGEGEAPAAAAATALLSFDDVYDVSSFLRCAGACGGAGRVAVQKASGLADSEEGGVGVEVDLCLAVGATDLFLGAPDCPATAAAVSRLMRGH